MAHRPTPTAPPRKQRKRVRTRKPDREDLRRMYEDEHLTQRQIAAKLGAALSSVRKWMAEESIETRLGRHGQPEYMTQQPEPVPEPEAEPEHRGLRGTFRRLSEVERKIVQKNVDDFLIYAAMQREEAASE